MKNLLLTSCYPPPLEGGSAVYLYRLFSHLPPEEVLVYTNSGPGDQVFDAEQGYPILRSGKPFTDLRGAEQLSTMLAWMRVAVPLARRERVTLVHAGYVYYEGVVARVVRLLTGIPYVVYLYAEELSLALRRRGLRGRVRRWLLTRAVRGAAGVVVVSDFTAELAARFGARPERTLKILPPVQVPGPHNPPPGSACDCTHLVPAGARLVLTVGRLIPRKGVDMLLEAWPSVLAEVPDAFLLVVGRGPDATRLAGLVDSLGPEGRARLAGFVPDAELPALYERCEVFALPHRETEKGDTEGCPTVFLEAGAHGRPVVAGTAGGARDAVLDGETGLVVDGRDPAAVAGAVVRLLKERAAALRMGEAGRRRAVEQLSPAAAAERLRGFCLGLMAAKEGE